MDRKCAVCGSTTEGSLGRCRFCGGEYLKGWNSTEHLILPGVHSAMDPSAAANLASSDTESVIVETLDQAGRSDPSKEND